MPNNTALITRLKEFLEYNPSDGSFTWKKRVNNRATAGMKAGTISNGYVSIQVDGRRHSAHRLAWLFHYGEWPSMSIDHIDGDKANNRISNLRDVSQSENMQNIHRANIDSRTGFLGVTTHKGRWKAQINIGGRQLHIGTYDTKEQAHSAYLAAKALREMLKRHLTK